MTIPACTAIRSSDGEPCWLLQHTDDGGPIQPVHMTRGGEIFLSPTDAWSNVGLSGGDQLRDAPEALKEEK